MKIAIDEFSVPTSTRTIVEVTLKVINAGLVGLYHLVNNGYASRYMDRRVKRAFTFHHC